MGYANIPLAIGWSYGSIMGGEVYDKMGDKANLSLRYLTEKFGIDPAAASDAIVAKLQSTGMAVDRATQLVTENYVQGEGIARTKATAFLQAVAGQDATQITVTLWHQYHPYELWYQFAGIGILSAIGVAIYAHFAHKWQAKDV
jgi:hypothetical protein